MNLPKEIQNVIDRMKVSDLSITENHLVVGCNAIEDVWNFIKAIPLQFIGMPIWINDRPSALIFNVVGKSVPKPLLHKSEFPEF
jgi:hypothetical protein